MIMKKLLSILLKQHQLGQFPGAAKSIFGRTLVYVGYANFSMIAAMAYTTFSDPLVHYIPWLSFRMFLGVLAIGLLVVMLLDYKFMLPSEWNFSWRQQWKHANPIREELKKLWDKLDKIEKKIDEGKTDD